MAYLRYLADLFRGLTASPEYQIRICQDGRRCFAEIHNGARVRHKRIFSNEEALASFVCDNFIALRLIVTDSDFREIAMNGF
jgi:hypothetical protein